VKASNDLSHREKAVIAGIAGATGAIVSNPFELINTRIIADGAIYKPHRRNYESFSDAYQKISKGGNRALYKGGLANVIRTVALNVSLTGPYDYLKEKMYITFGDADLFNHHISLIWATFWGTLAVLPFENVRVRMMK